MKKTDFTALGRIVGKGSGWDQADTFSIIIYDFQPLVSCLIPEADSVYIHFESGIVEAFTGDTSLPFWSGDLIDSIKNCITSKTNDSMKKIYG